MFEIGKKYTLAESGCIRTCLFVNENVVLLSKVENPSQKENKEWLITRDSSVLVEFKEYKEPVITKKYIGTNQNGTACGAFEHFNSFHPDWNILECTYTDGILTEVNIVRNAKKGG